MYRSNLTTKPDIIIAAPPVMKILKSYISTLNDNKQRGGPILHWGGLWPDRLPLRK
jgi:hypothetical protein